jgi:hypothetical protein
MWVHGGRYLKCDKGELAECRNLGFTQLELT